MLFMVNFKTKVLHAVRYSQVFQLVFLVIPRGLFYHLLINGNRMSLEFNDHHWLTLPVVHQGISAHGHLMPSKAAFQGYQRCRVPLFFHEEPDKMLPDPFFRGKFHVFSTPFIKNVINFALVFYFKRISW